MKAFKITLLLFLILLILVFGAFVALRMSGLELQLSAPHLPLLAPAPPPLPSGDTLPKLALQPATAEEKLLDQAYAAVWSYTPDGECETDGKTAQQKLTLTVLDADRFAGSGLREELIGRLSQRVERAQRASEVYDAQFQYLPELVREDYLSLLQERGSHAGDFCQQQSVTLRYVYEDDGWVLQNPEVFYPLQPNAESLYAAAAGDLPYQPLHYTIEENALCGPVPREENFIVTDDPAVISALLERPEAKALIGDETLLWNPDLTLIPGSLLRCYLDESILCIVWQEEEARAVGTFSEIFIADGSQLRRKISSDEPFSYGFERTSSFARNANAVLAVGGDFYYHGRNCGISVYQREIIRFRPDNADTCFITADGDMLFRYLGDDTDYEDTKEFLRDNDVLFSLAFGPVLIDDGVDVTPEDYLWGEVKDYYARSSLGLLGRHHYLTMNINCGKRGTEYDHLPSLRDAADAMVRRGCWKAYTLDGGQTATTAFHYELINPVQFGKEKNISDVIYFATAVPEE